MDLNNLMQMAGQLRTQLAEVQNQAAQKRYVGEAGAGLVRVVMTGRYETVEVKIDPKAIDPKDLRLLEDLVRAAVNQVTAQVTEGQKVSLGAFARQFGIDPSMLGQAGLI